MAAVVETVQGKISEVKPVETMKEKLKEVKLPQIAMREDLYKELEKLKAAGEEEAAVVQRFLEQSLAHQLISKAGVGKPYVLTPGDANKAAEIFKNLMALGYSSVKSATICRALFNEQTPEDMTEAFNQFDEEGKGSIQAEEVKHFLPALGVALPPLKMHHFLQECGVGSTKEDRIDISGFASVLKHANPNGMESLYAKLPNLGIGSTLYNMSSGVSHFREAYGAGLSDSISIFDTRKAGVIIENFAAADLPKEMAVKVCRAVLGDQSDEAMQDAFKYFDKDGRGTIDAEEFKKCLPLMGEDLSDEKLQELFAITDKNSSGCLDLQEFTALVKALNPKAAAAEALAAAEAEASAEAEAEAEAAAAPESADAEAPPAEAAPAASASSSSGGGWFSSFFGGGSKDKKKEEEEKKPEEEQEEQAAEAEAEAAAEPKDRSEGLKVEGADTGVDPEEAKKGEDASAGAASAILGSAGANGVAAAEAAAAEAAAAEAAAAEAAAAEAAAAEAEKKPEEESNGEKKPEEEESNGEKKPEEEEEASAEKKAEEGDAEKKPEEEGKAEEPKAEAA